MKPAQPFFLAVFIVLVAIGCTTRHQQTVLVDRREAELAAWNAQAEASKTNFGPLFVALGSLLGSCSKK
jgi:hypothetical protein